MKFYRSILVRRLANFTASGNLSDVIVVKMFIGMVVVAIVGVALIPLYVVADMRGGGSGGGLCETGFGTCSTSYYAGFELVGVLLAVLMVLVGLVGILVRLKRYLDTRTVAAARR